MRGIEDELGEENLILAFVDLESVIRKLILLEEQVTYKESTHIS